MKQLPEIRDRPAGKIPTTTVTNELAGAIRGLAPNIHTGQVFEPPRGGAATLPYGEFPGMLLTTRTQNQVGFDFFVTYALPANP